MQSKLESGSARRGIGYSVLFPPGWREFKTTVEFEHVFIKLVTAEAKSAGRADVVLILRQKMHEMFEQLRRRGALGFAIPMNKLTGGFWPASLIVTPLKVGTTGKLSDAVGRAAGGNTVDTERIDGADWYLWKSSYRPEEASEIQNHGLNMVVPRPLPDGTVDPDPTAGLWLLFSYAEINGVMVEEEADQLRELGLAILGTFKWETVQ
ncbi:hypothetical protein [Glutamicibacter sp.]|uniref:hypothetical protein n=1 Tax=Glutamicibacter sp. TaxID=1931995 RepID=UPI0028BD3320|nr:hypothetical protein [Glutamicibacter sp.]